MNQATRCGRWIRLGGIAALMLGITHVAATPVIMDSGFHSLTADETRVFIYMFVAAGLALIASGLLLIHLSGALKKTETWAYIPSLGTAVFILIMGVGAPLAMSDNPFAWITLILALFLIFPFLRWRGQYM